MMRIECKRIVALIESSRALDDSNIQLHMQAENSASVVFLPPHQTYVIVTRNTVKSQRVESSRICQSLYLSGSLTDLELKHIRMLSGFHQAELCS
jgi:hypothetical protein